MSKRQARLQQFVAAPGAPSLSQELLHCSLLLLQSALHDRQHPVHRTRTNHYSPHALGSIVLLVDGLEAYLNHVIAFLWPFSRDKAQRSLANRRLRDKYYQIPQRFANVGIRENPDLDLVVDLRNEIAHYLPRGISEEGNVPSWFHTLHRRRLFITTGQKDQDFVFAFKLGSYRLAYWAWETVDHALIRFLRALGKGAGVEPRWLSSYFTRYKVVCPPRRLPDYDVRNNLSLT